MATKSEIARAATAMQTDERICWIQRNVARVRSMRELERFLQHALDTMRELRK